MPPKKDDGAAAAPGDTITGFTSKETKMIAAAFVASTGPDKYDYDLFATLTGNTAGSLKKMWPPVKRKVIDAHPAFGTFLGAATAPTDGDAKKAAPKAKSNGGKKRKATSAEPGDGEGVQEGEAEGEDTGKKKAGPKSRKKKGGSVEAEEGEKKGGAKRGRKKIKSEEEVVDEDVDEEGAEEGAKTLTEEI